MLKDLMKKLSGKEPEAKTEEVAVPEAANTEVLNDVQADVVDVIDEALVAANTITELTATVATLTASLEAAAAQIAELKDLYADAQAAAANLADDAEEKRMADRKEKIVAAIGTEKSDALFTATEGLDDTAFAAVLSAMAGSVEAEADSPLFKEVGVAAEADAATIVQKSEEMKLLEEKYKTAQKAN